MQHVINGVLRFQSDIFPNQRGLFAKLATGQNPEVLFITCADSRVDLNLITQTSPGELFICRNAGNIVPPHGVFGGGMTASIEYAVAVLGVGHVVICGHTDCGAMRGACDLDGLSDELQHVKSWLGQSRAAIQIVRERYGFVGEEHLEEMIEQNVLVQMQHLRTHPTVAAKLALGKIELHGWVYEIATGKVRCHDEGRNAFVPLEERYATLLSAD
ncbi:MAG: carbonic anhydrase [Planctomycetota bacterium]